MEKQDRDNSPIVGFRDEHEWLSNFHPCKIGGGSGNPSIPTAEHAYQAKKTNDKEWKKKILSAPTPGKAKRLGRQAPLIFGWENLKLNFMEDVLWSKFYIPFNPELRQKLLDTGDRELVEDNNWGDTFWGVYNGIGENHLGKLLMKTRDKIRCADENWEKLQTMKGNR